MWFWLRDPVTGEGFDMPVNLSLPDKQDELISTVAEANANTVVVLETGGPVTMPWAAEGVGRIEAWYLGTSGGEAIAGVLPGEVNPSGRLPATRFPASESQRCRVPRWTASRRWRTAASTSTTAKAPPSATSGST
ncbi:glycoside hydrolase family 3 C-terminal domain-containing protein [Duganella sp. BJB1802]|uniref:glycoside hydrolase family 3 protein n=1 Tax=Duganella sp. BJB1802 TaxID=2744575 RepID=UPI001E5ACEFF|nr:glycoside hydrolase family 3 C-terminal domain-containing protein [Duganella sp. BJB1802]